MPTRYTYRITPVPYIRTHLFPDPAHARRYTPDGRAQRLSAALEAVFNLANVVVLGPGAALVAVRVGNAVVELVRTLDEAFLRLARGRPLQTGA